MDAKAIIKAVLMEDITSESTLRKDKLLRAALVKHNIPEYKDDHKRRFSKFKVERTEDNKEIWYYDDGSINGKEIISFNK